MQLISNRERSAIAVPALFLDRDGIINIDYGHVGTRDRFRFTDNIFSLVIAANALGYLVVVVTNQAGIGRGLYTLGEFKKLSDWMCQKCEDNGAKIDAVYFSPFHPTAGQGSYLLDEGTRKPKPGMIFEAVLDLNINLEKSVMVGDQISDMQAAINAGIPDNFLLASGRNLDVPTYFEGKVKIVSSLFEIIPEL